MKKKQISKHIERDDKEFRKVIAIMKRVIEDDEKLKKQLKKVM